MLSRLLLLSVGPRAKWVVLALWLIPVVALATFSIKFNDVQSDNPALFTPSGGESIQATAILHDQFPGGLLAQAIVVYQRPNGLTAADQARMRADMASFHGARRLVAGRAQGERGDGSGPCFLAAGGRIPGVQAISFEFYAVAARQSAVRDYLRSYFGEFRDLLAAIIQRGIDSGEFRAGVDPQVAAFTIVALLEGLTLLWMIDPQAVRPAGDGEQAIRLLLDGLRADAVRA